MKPYTWRAAIIKSSLPPTTRHVLLTLSLYMNDVGQSAYPSTKTLASDTGLSERAVITHLQHAKDKGWLTVARHGFGGQRWAHHEYFPRLPDEEYEEVPMEKGAEVGSARPKKGLNVVQEGAERRSKGTERSDIKALNDVQSNKPYELSKELSNLNNKKSEALNTKPATFKPAAHLHNLGVDDQTIEDWLAHRKHKKASSSLTVITSRIEEAGKAGISLEAALKLEISRNWQGFDASWLAPRLQNAARLPHPDRRSTDERRLSDNEEARRILFGNKSTEVIDV